MHCHEAYDGVFSVVQLINVVLLYTCIAAQWCQLEYVRHFNTNHGASVV